MKQVVWVGSSLPDLKEFPEEVQAEAGYALHLAQRGERASCASPLTGFGSAKVLELIIPEGGDTYRVVYIVKFESALYVLHAFQKKSKKGAKTPMRDMNLVRSRLKDAEKCDREWKKTKGPHSRGDPK